MQKLHYLRIVSRLEALLSELQHALEERLVQLSIEGPNRAELLRQRLAVTKMSDQVRLLKYADVEDLPKPHRLDLESLEQDYEHLVRGIAVRRGGQELSFQQAIERTEENINSIILPLEIVGKWPPDGAPG